MSLVPCSKAVCGGTAVGDVTGRRAGGLTKRRQGSGVPTSLLLGRWRPRERPWCSELVELRSSLLSAADVGTEVSRRFVCLKSQRSYSVPAY